MSSPKGCGGCSSEKGALVSLPAEVPDWYLQLCWRQLNWPWHLYLCYITVTVRVAFLVILEAAVKCLGSPGVVQVAHGGSAC